MLPLDSLMVLFALKHFLCDFVLQATFYPTDKGKYGGKGGLLHAAIHGAGTSIIAGGWLGLLDAVIHYHIDYAKARLAYKCWAVPSVRYWVLMIADQTLHILTYAGIIWCIR